MKFTAEDIEALAKEKRMNFFPSKQIIEKCVALCKQFPQSADDLLARIEAFLINQSSLSLTLELLGPFEASMHADFQKGLQTPNTHNPAPKRPAPSSDLTPRKEVKTETPESIAPQSVGQPYTPAPDGMVVASHNASLGQRGEFVPSPQMPRGTRCLITQDDEDCANIQHRFRYMYTPVEERAREQDKLLLRMQGFLCKRSHVDENTLTPVGTPSQDVVFCCGRVVNETQGKLNKTSIVLEGSRRDSNGRRAQILLDLPSYSLFPGQIVLVEGINSSGRRMTVKRIVDGCAAPMPSSSPEALLKYHHTEEFLQHSHGLRIMTACGPFTSSDDLKYEPLYHLLGNVLRDKPDVLILIGPFVDINQPLLANGSVELLNDDEDATKGKHGANYEMVFVEKIVRDGLQTLFNSDPALATQIILIPSLSDAHHEMVFPQPPIGDRDEVRTPWFEESLGILTIPDCKGEQKRVHLFSNPCMFRINDVLFATCSTDVLFALSSDEISQGLEGNRLCRLAGHMLQQQSFAPQFPVPVNAYPAQLDMRQSKHWTMQRCPDILLLPSKLSPMAKEVAVHGVDGPSTVLVVNPGPLVKGRAGGNYADMTIHPMDASKLRDAVLKNVPELKHEVSTRTAVQIVKI